MKRRQFLKAMFGAGAALMAGGMRNPLEGTGLLFGAEPVPAQRLLVVFLRGGYDSVNVVVPYGDPDYYRLRPTIAIPAPNGTTSTALDLNGFFGFHPAMSSLMPAWQAGQVALFPAVHYPNPSRSHFDSQQIIESGVDNIGEVGVLGWLNRLLVQNTRLVPLQAFGFESSVPHSLRGSYSALALPDLSRVSGSLSQTEADALVAALEEVYGASPASPHPHTGAVYETGQMFLQDLGFLRSVASTAYTAANGAVYPSNGFAKQLQQLAQLIKTDCGLEVMTISHGGWDTHSGQGGVSGNQANRMLELSQSLAAFRTDLGSWGDGLTILVMSEFGREVGENASGGTDHGHACAWMAIGPRVKGGVYGTWPGLSSSALDSGRFLAATVDYRDIMAQAALQLLPTAELADLFPGHDVQLPGYLL